MSDADAIRGGRQQLASALVAQRAAVGRQLIDWLPRQRWFPGKARTITDARIHDAGVAGDRLVLVLLEVRYADGGGDLFSVPLLAPGGDPVVASVDGTPLSDALADDEACRLLGELAVGRGRIPMASGAIVVGELVEPPAPTLTAVRRLSAEQSNTSVVFADPAAGSAILKVLRRVEPGENPDVELPRTLTQAGSPHVPAVRGVLSLRDERGTNTALAVLADFLAGATEGWAMVSSAAETVAGGGAADPRLARRMRDLGVAVAEIHATLDERLGGRNIRTDDLNGWAQAAVAQVEAVLKVAAERAPDATVAVRQAREQILAALARMAQAGDAGRLMRIHGDLHLGQVLLDADGGWRVLDFEGEPARALAERRAPASPLRDVAGMLRSFDYAVGHAVLQIGEGADEEALGVWRDSLRAAFLDGYVLRAGAFGFLGTSNEDTNVLLDAFELDKAVYELGYELANRPNWVPIPIGGILRTLARSGRGSSTASHSADSAEGISVPKPSASRSADWKARNDEVGDLLAGHHTDPHHVLGVHPLEGGGAVVRAFRPDAESVTVITGDGKEHRAERTWSEGFFEALIRDEVPKAGQYRLRVRYPGGAEYTLVDPYSFWPTFGPMDLHLAGEGRHEELWQRLGAHVTTNEGISGTSFAVWAPNAKGVRVVGDFNSWDGRLHPMRLLGGSGIWELFVPDVGSGSYYRYELVTEQGHLVTRADPYAFATDVPPGNASRVFASTYQWGDAAWFAEPRRGGQPTTSPISVYEAHLGSWRYRDGRPLTYRELADDLVGHVNYLGFTHVELLPVAEHPFGGSWGYQVTGYYAPTARFGNPDDFRYLVDRLHQAGIGVIVDWVPAHFPRDEWALARFDGTALYEHEDPRQGSHPDWGTLVFNFGRNEVRNFLIANALYWLEEMHVDGLRVDAVASMLYLDYSREEGQWVPNRFGGRENLEAVDFLKELNAVVYGRNPHAMMIAEESTAWPGVSRPAYLGGLGFGFKWNMGWMHDTLSYIALDPIYRRHHHNQLTFSLMYAFSENFILPLSHDEVVHGKRSLIDKMPGDRWQKFANLRALYGYMWAHPGKQLLFMGGEFGQWREWSEERELDWYLLHEDDHQGLQRLVADLNARYRELPALWQRDSDPGGFTWIDPNNADDNVLSFVRFGEDAPPLVCLSNFSPVPRTLRVGVPGEGAYREVLNTDAGIYGGANIGNYGEVHAAPEGWQGQPASAVVTIPPLASVWLART